MSRRESIVRIGIFAVIMTVWLVCALGLPPLSESTGPHRAAVAILLTAAILWISELVPLFVTSLLLLLMCIVWLTPELRQQQPDFTADVFLSQFFSDIILLFLGGFVLSAALRKQHLDEWIGRWILQKTGSSLSLLMFGVMGLTAFLSMWLSNTATAAMMLALVIPISEQLPSDSSWRKALLLSIPFSANIGGLGTPIGSPPNAIAMKYLQSIEAEPSFAQWMLIGVPGVVSLLLVTWFVLKLLYGRKHVQLTIPTDQAAFSHSQSVYLVFAAIFVTVGGWLTAGIHGWSTGTVALLPILLLFGSGVLQVSDLRTLSWDVLILMGGGLCLGTALSESGLAAWLVERLPVSGSGAYQVMLVFGVVACVMSSVMSNTAAANLLMPIALGLQMEPLQPLLIGIAFACSVAMPLPVSTPPNAMAFGSGQLTVVDMLRPGLIVTVLGVALAFTAGYWWWDWIGLF